MYKLLSRGIRAGDTRRYDKFPGCVRGGARGRSGGDFRRPAGSSASSLER